MKVRQRTQRIASIGILAALSIVILYLIPPFPIIPAIPFLQHDFADVPIFIATFMFGPLTGLAITSLVCLIQGITISFQLGGLSGIIMHFFATGSFVIVSGLIYKKFHTFKGAIIALVSGVVTWVLIMIPLNLIVTSMFMGDAFSAKSWAEFMEIYKKSLSSVLQLLPLIIAFNVCKSLINSIVTLILYKSMHKILQKMFATENAKSNSCSTTTAENITTTDNNNVCENTVNSTIENNDICENKPNTTIETNSVCENK